MGDAVRGFVQVPHALIRAGGSPNVMWVYLAMVSRGGRDGVCTAGRKQLAADAGCSENTVKRAHGILERLGLIHVDRRPGLGNVVTVVKPRDVPVGTLQEIRTVASEVGPLRPGVGPERADYPGLSGPQRRNTQGDIYKENLKTNAGGVRREMSEAQRVFLLDIALLRGELSVVEAEDEVASLTCSYIEADELIAVQWSELEHDGRDAVAYQALRDTEVWDRLSGRGRAFVERVMST